MKTRLAEARTRASEKDRLLRFHQPDNAFDAEKRGMAFVHVIHGRLHAERFQGSISADPEKNLLPDTHFQIPAIKLRGNLAVFGPVGRQIRVQQKKLDPADIHVPDLRVHLSVRQFDGHFHVWNELDRPRVEIIVFKSFLLPAGGIEVLPEIPLLVEKPDTHERKAQIAGGFQMIARQARPARRQKWKGIR